MARLEFFTRPARAGVVPPDLPAGVADRLHLLLGRGLVGLDRRVLGGADAPGDGKSKADRKAAEKARGRGRSARDGGRGPRRARLQLRHIDTWSALKISLVLSIALMGLASSFIARIIGRFRWIAWIGLLIILFVAAKMIYEGWHDISDHIPV